MPVELIMVKFYVKDPRVMNHPFNKEVRDRLGELRQPAERIIWVPRHFLTMGVNDDNDDADANFKLYYDYLVQV